MSSTEQTPATEVKPILCGGIESFRPVDENDLKIWDMYKTPLEKKIREQFQVPETHLLKPVQVATQVVAGRNYFFKLELPEKKFATARVYHVPWKAETHGQADHVAVHQQLHDTPNENHGHF